MELNLTALISIFSILIPVVWSAYQYLDTKRRDQDLREFENYHNLIKGLVQPEHTPNGEKVIFADRQAAILFELRHFKRYYPISYRILLNLKEQWHSLSTYYPRLIEELNLTIEYLKNKL